MLRTALGAPLLALLALPALPCAAAADPLPVLASLASLPYDENDRLASHVLAYPAGACAALVAASPVPDGTFGHRFAALDGAARAAVFGHLEERGGEHAVVISLADCVAACLERGTPRSLVARPLPHRYWRRGAVEDEGEPRPVGSLDAFLHGDACGQVEYGFVNYHSREVKVYWVHHESGERVFNQDLGVGERETSFITTFVGHRFECYDSQPHEDPLENELLESVTVEGHGVVGIKNHVQPHVPPEGVEREVRTTLQNEWGRHLKIRRTFSALGFAKGRLPPDLHASLSAYHYNNRHPPHKVLEEWGRHKGVFVNYWETDINFIQIPWVLKGRWQGRLRELVEAWTGVALETTDMYGMREYTAGARLLTHVDRESTHAASLIVNVAQENVTRPWTIEVHDHADRLHEVVMEPGDIVYYESAKSLHGRNTPLRDGNYVNLFTHYRPTDDPEWYLRANPAGTPPPLLDVGRCRLEGAATEYSRGAVACDDPAIGPHLSPTRFVARNGHDLFEWWKSVGPAEEGGEGGEGGGGEEGGGGGGEEL